MFIAKRRIALSFAHAGGAVRGVPALNNGALLAGSGMNPNVCQTCHRSFPTDNTALVGSLNHCDIVR